MSKRKQKVNKGTLRRVLELIRPYAGLVVLTLVLAVVTVVTTLLAPVISGKAVDHIIGPGQVDFGGVGKLAIAMAGTVACTAVSQWLMNVVNNRITFHVVRDMRVRAFEQLEQLPLKYMDAHRHRRGAVQRRPAAGLHPAVYRHPDHLRYAGRDAVH